MPLSCQRSSSGGSLGKMVLQNPLISEADSLQQELFTFVYNNVFWWRLHGLISALPPQPGCERLSHPTGSRGPVDPAGGGHVRQDHLWASTGLDSRVRQNSKVRIIGWLTITQNLTVHIVVISRDHPCVISAPICQTNFSFKHRLSLLWMFSLHAADKISLSDDIITSMKSSGYFLRL